MTEPSTGFYFPPGSPAADTPSPSTFAARARREHDTAGGRRDPQRHERLLDVTRDLVLRVGYSKVHISDIAEAAGIGKGTVYLHWTCKDAIIDELLVREFTESGCSTVHTDESTPAAITLAATSARLYRAAMGNPLLRAYNTDDVSVLGSRGCAPGGPDRLGISMVSVLTCLDYLGVLHRHGLLREDVCSLGGRTAVGAVISGFVLQSARRCPDDAHIATSRLLAAVVHRCFEPDTVPDRSSMKAAQRTLTAGQVHDRRSVVTGTGH